MKLKPIIRQLRLYCPSFDRRVFGGLDWDPTKDGVRADLPAAYVVYVGDEAEHSDIQTGIRQRVRDSIDVNVEISNADERGQAATDLLHDLRAELWRALVGFEPGSDGTPLQYDDGQLLLINRSKAVYRFRFYTDFMIGRTEARHGEPVAPPETWLEVQQDGLALFEGVDIDVDFIDPMRDPNLSTPGPDGRIEIKVREDLNP